jgi:hypothetical protein
MPSRRAPSRDGQLTGAKIVESTLAQVPSAKNADTAASEQRREPRHGSAQYFRANGTGVTVLYGWREDALGAATACRICGEAISG